MTHLMINLKTVSVNLGWLRLWLQYSQQTIPNFVLWRL